MEHCIFLRHCRCNCYELENGFVFACSVLLLFCLMFVFLEGRGGHVVSSQAHSYLDQSVSE